MATDVRHHNRPMLYRAALDTSHWAFEAYGRTPAEAKYYLARAWALHCEETGAATDLIAEDIADLTPYAVSSGQAYRDDHRLIDEDDTARPPAAS